MSSGFLKWRKRYRMTVMSPLSRGLFHPYAHLAWSAMTLGFSLQLSPLLFAQEKVEHSVAKTLEERKGQPSVREGLTTTMKMVERELNQQEKALKAAQTDQERQLIQMHIKFLQGEEASLRELLVRLVGQRVDIQEGVDEGRRELRDERIERQLERERQPRATKSK